MLAASVCIARAAHAQNQGDLRFDLNPSRLSIIETPFAIVRGAQQHIGFTGRARASYLDRPLSLVVAGPTADGTESHLIAGTLAAEVAINRSYENGLDFGLNLGAHLYQFGDGDTPISGQSSTVPPFGAMDPLTELGYTWQKGSLLLRPFVAVYIPLGTAQAFAGEKKTRVEGGFSTFHRFSFIEWGAEVSLLYRPVIEFSTTRLGPQAKLGLAARALFATNFSAGLEFMMRPFLTPQHLGKGTALIPAEALLNLGYQNHNLSIHFTYGVGLPTSHISTDIVKAGLFRAPGTPRQRFLLDVEFTFGESKKSSAAHRRPVGPS